MKQVLGATIQNLVAVATWPPGYVHPLTFYSMAQQPPVGQGLPVIEASRSHSGIPQSVGLLWTSDQPVAEAST